MRKLLLLSTLILAFAPWRPLEAQKYRKKETSLTSFSLNIDPVCKAKLDQLSHVFPEPRNSKADRIINQIKLRTWEILYDRLQSEIGMVILPLDAYGDKFAYDAYYFPDVNISKAIKNGASKYYFKVEMDIVPDVSAKYISAKNGNGKDSTNHIVLLRDDEIKPKVVITIYFFSDKGILPIEKGVGTAIAPMALKVDASLFDGITNDNPDNDQTTLFSLIEDASGKVVRSILANQR